MTKQLALLTALLAVNFLNPNSSDKKQRTAQELSQAAPERPDRTHNGAVAGIVSDDKGASIGEATVMLQDTVTEESPATTTTTEKGHYKFTSLLPGEYTVWAKKGDEESAHLQIKVANGTISNADLVLRKSGTHM